jgi:hypothetical protein
MLSVQEVIRAPSSPLERNGQLVLAPAGPARLTLHRCLYSVFCKGASTVVVTKLLPIEWWQEVPPRSWC